ncbi:E22 family MetX-like putative esterase [Noviherbaspirillum sedimenti]|nr:homoserine O-acetyltransferase [Noviherbaspirillum sedimenti]
MGGKDNIFEVLQAQDGVGLVEKQVFTMPSYTTIGGKTIRDVRIGYETYGTLNARGDNAILIAHYFSGTSHAAGRYATTDTETGYWDAIIGPGKAIDTDRYFVVSADTLANVNAGDRNAVTTGPASIDPDTGKPYGMRFPIVTIRDFVNVQKALVDALGIRKLHAVAGPSMGSMQAIEWAVAFPDMVERVAAVIPAGLEADPYLVATLNIWMAPIMLDPDWNQGDYYGAQAPVKGLAATLKNIMLNGLHPGWANAACGRKPALAADDMLRDFGGRFLIETTLEQVGLMRADMLDANSLLYTAKACQLFSIAHQGTLQDAARGIKGKVLLMPAVSDLLMLPDYARKAAELLRACGKQVDYVELQGVGGHFDGLQAIGQAGSALRHFIDT